MHNMHNKMLLRAIQFSDLLSHSTLTFVNIEHSAKTEQIKKIKRKNDKIICLVC